MAYSSAHNNIDWHNRSEDLSTPLGKSNLSKINTELSIHDTRILELDLSRLTSTDINAVIKNVTLNSSTGELVFTKWDNTTITIDTLLEKVAVNFTFDENTQELKIALDDGTVKVVSLSSFIHETEFVDTDTIAVTVTSDHTVKMDVKDNSIGERQLQTGYLTNIKGEAAKAEAARDAALLAKSAAEAASTAGGNSALLAESWAHGNTGVRLGEDTDNAKYWSQVAAQIAGFSIATVQQAGIVKPDGTTITIDSDGTIHGVPQTICDTILSTSSTNPVENRVITRFIFEVLDELTKGRVISPVVDNTADAITDEDGEFMYGSVPFSIGG